MTGSQPTDVLSGKATGAPTEAPAGAPTDATAGAPATNNIQKMPVKLCKLITQSPGNNWPSLRDISGIFSSCVFFVTFLCALSNYLFLGIAVRCVWVGYRVETNCYFGISYVVAFFLSASFHYGFKFTTPFE